MKTCMITGELVQTILGKRSKEIHKGDCGRVLIVAGSEGMMGAAVLSCRSALRSGAGLVQLAVPKELFPVAQVAVPEATCRVRRFSAEDLARYDAVAIGPGLGTEEKSVEEIRSLLKLYDGPLVLDADALNLMAEPENRLLELVRKRKGETILTPHIGEARRLMGLLAEDAGGAPDSEKKPDGEKVPDALDRDGRVDFAKKLVKLTGAAVVLKGTGTVVATLEEKSYINTTGNPGMATGGSGDVLTGVIAGLWGQKQRCEDGGFRRLTALEAAACGVFLHGLAGDLAAAETGEYGLIAGDIAAKLPFAIRQITEGK